MTQTTNLHMIAVISTGAMELNDRKATEFELSMLMMTAPQKMTQTHQPWTSAKRYEVRYYQGMVQGIDKNHLAIGRCYNCDKK